MLPADLLTYARQHGYTHVRHASATVLFLYRPAPVDPTRWGQKIILRRTDQLYLEAPSILVDTLPTDAQSMADH